MTLGKVQGKMKNKHRQKNKGEESGLQKEQAINGGLEFFGWRLGVPLWPLKDNGV